MHNADRRVAAKDLRRLATWYRDFAERAGSITIWEARLHMAEDLEREADKLASSRAYAAEEEQGNRVAYP
jgi:hypothetical protein